MVGDTWEINLSGDTLRIRYSFRDLAGKPGYFELQTPNRKIVVSIDGVPKLSLLLCEAESDQLPASHPEARRSKRPKAENSNYREIADAAAALLDGRGGLLPVREIAGAVSTEPAKPVNPRTLYNVLKGDDRFEMVGSRYLARWKLAKAR